MVPGSNKKPQSLKRQPALSRLSQRGARKTMTQSAKALAKRQPARDELGRFTKTPITAQQRRDKYVRFAKNARLSWLRHHRSPVRDKNGRFASSTKQRLLKRDKLGRFTKTHPVWPRQVAISLLFIILGVGGMLYFVLQLNRPIVIERPIAANSVPSPVIAPINSKFPESLPRSEPTRLRISKIDLDTTFVSVGRKIDGTMETPSRYDIVGWYTGAPTPGEIGPAIIVGHVDRVGGIAIFWRLRELLPGDIFEVDRADGKTVKFKVDEVKQLPQDGFPTEEVYGNINYAGIRLITCGGIFNRQSRQYSDNTVVYGSLVPRQSNISSSNLTL